MTDTPMHDADVRELGLTYRIPESTVFDMTNTTAESQRNMGAFLSKVEQDIRKAAADYFEHIG